jgi:hypothetical protein
MVIQFEINRENITKSYGNGDNTGNPLGRQYVFKVDKLHSSLIPNENLGDSQVASYTSPKIARIPVFETVLPARPDNGGIRRVFIHKWGLLGACRLQTRQQST